MSRRVTDEEVYALVQLNEQGFTIQEIADKCNRTYKSVEMLLARHRGVHCRAFNFPHIIHAPRFGATSNASNN